MESTPALLLALLIVAAVVVIAAFVWYNNTGWAPFAYSTGATSVCWPADDMSRLRFKDAVFTLNVGGKAYTKDVTAVLNGMAAGNKGAPNNGILTLDAALNPFSFVVANVNTKAVVPDPTVAMWKSAQASLEGSVKTL